MPFTFTATEMLKVAFSQGPKKSLPSDFFYRFHDQPEVVVFLVEVLVPMKSWLLLGQEVFN